MAEMLKKVSVQFTKSGSPDIVGYKLYAAPQGTPIDRQSALPFDLGMPVFDNNGVGLVDLSTINGIGALDGIYDLGICAVDDAGNESEMLTEGLAGVNLDFVAPDPPTAASVIYGS